MSSRGDDERGAPAAVGQDADGGLKLVWYKEPSLHPAYKESLLCTGESCKTGQSDGLQGCENGFFAPYSEQIKLQAKLLNYFSGSNKSNINQSSTWC